ncbi:hypothetical protein F7725_006210, partial [Dissostichus mawsoni]
MEGDEAVAPPPSQWDRAWVGDGDKMASEHEDESEKWSSAIKPEVKTQTADVGRSNDLAKTLQSPQPRSKKQRKKNQCSLFFPTNGVCFRKSTHTTCFHTKALLCVGHFGSAVTILDKRVVSWSQNGGWFFLPVFQHAGVGVGASADEGSEGVMKSVKGEKRAGGVNITTSDAMPDLREGLGEGGVVSIGTDRQTEGRADKRTDMALALLVKHRNLGSSTYPRPEHRRLLFFSSPALIPRSLWLLAPVILVRLTIRFMQALAGPSSMGGPLCVDVVAPRVALAYVGRVRMSGNHWAPYVDAGCPRADPRSNGLGEGTWGSRGEASAGTGAWENAGNRAGMRTPRAGETLGVTGVDGDSLSRGLEGRSVGGRASAVGPNLGGRSWPCGRRGSRLHVDVGQLGSGAAGDGLSAECWSPRSRGPGCRSPNYCPTAKSHLSVSSSFRPLAGGTGPVAVLGVPGGVVVSFRAVALLVHGAVMVMVVMVVATVLGPAAVPLALLWRKVARLRGGAESSSLTPRPARPWTRLEVERRIGLVSVMVCEEEGA